MNVRISASYAATDGSMPESVELEWTDVGPDMPGVLLFALDHLLAAPRERLMPLTARDEADGGV